jgi:hypothetical protein
MPLRALRWFLCCPVRRLKRQRVGGFGVLFLKNGMVYGGDSHSAFMGDFKDHGNILTRASRSLGWRADTAR